MLSAGDVQVETLCKKMQLSGIMQKETYQAVMLSEPLEK